MLLYPLLTSVYWHWKANANRSDVLSPSGVVVDGEKEKPSVFLLVGIRKNHIKTPS